MNRVRRRRCSASRARSAFASFWRATSSEEPSSFVRNGQQQHSKPEWRQVVKKFISAVFVAVLAVGATLGAAQADAKDWKKVRIGVEGAYPPFSEVTPDGKLVRSEEHTSELQSLMRISYTVYCFKK